MGERDHVQNSQQGGLDPRLRRLLKGKCRVARCGKPLKDGSVWCVDCDPVQRDRAAKRQAKRRAELAAQKLCINGCGARCQKDGQRCRDCAREHRAACATRRECHAEHVSVAPVPTTQPRTKLEVQPDGYTRVRTTGRGTKAVTREDRDQNLRDELTWAISHLTWLRDEGIAALRSPSIAELGRIQRDEASRIVADRALEAARLARGVAREIHAKRVAEIDREIREALEADAKID